MLVKSAFHPLLRYSVYCKFLKHGPTGFIFKEFFILYTELSTDYVDNLKRAEEAYKKHKAPSDKEVWEIYIIGIR
jgi:hypothetical protein